MRIHLHDANRPIAAALKAIKDGDIVALTDQGVPVAIMQPIREASKQEEEVIREMIESGALQPVQKSGAVREWKWKSTRTKAA